MAATKQKTAKDLKKKKKWVPIFSGKDFGSLEIGETFVDEAELCKGKTIETNLMSMTKDSRKHGNVNVVFKINNYSNNQLFADLISYNLQVSQLKRTTRKDKDKIEDSFIVKTKDGVDVAVKPIILTKAETKNSILTAVRILTRTFTSDFAKNMTFNQFMNEIISGNLQREIKNNVKKAYPIANCTIRAAVRKN